MSPPCSTCDVSAERLRSNTTADIDSQYATSAGYGTPGPRSAGTVPAEGVHGWRHRVARPSVPNTWIQERVCHIHDDVGAEDEHRADDGHAHDHREIVAGDRIDGELTESRESEEVLGDDEAGQDRREVDA